MTNNKNSSYRRALTERAYTQLPYRWLLSYHDRKVPTLDSRMQAWAFISRQI